MILFGVLILGIGAVAIFSDPGPPTDPSANAPRAPHIIERPNEGTGPQNPGDRGGWEQLLVLAMIIVSVVVIGLVVFRGGSKARANRERWKAAGRSGRSGQDGAIGPAP